MRFFAGIVNRAENRMAGFSLSGVHRTVFFCFVMAYRFPFTTIKSGILSVSALLLGADSAVAVDIDPLAVKTAKENGKNNGFDEPVYKVLQGSLTDKVTGRYDIIAANIVADIVILLCSDVKSFMK